MSSSSLGFISGLVLFSNQGGHHPRKSRSDEMMRRFLVCRLHGADPPCPCDTVATCTRFAGAQSECECDGVCVACIETRGQRDISCLGRTWWCMSSTAQRCGRAGRRALLCGEAAVPVLANWWMQQPEQDVAALRAQCGAQLAPAAELSWPCALFGAWCTHK